MLSTIGELFGDHEVNDFIDYKTHVSDSKFWSTELDNVPFLDRSTVGSLLDLEDSPPTYDEFYTSKFMIPSAVQPIEVSGFSSIPSTAIPQDIFPSSLTFDLDFRTAEPLVCLLISGAENLSLRRRMVPDRVP
uniref:Uncharacterized protein n=1 Tax=Anopheles maculatus TaxID=74869 RepID=A0A182T285_9DIPT